MPPRLKLRVWTPLPPGRSGVADHNLLLLPALAALADVSVVADDGARVPAGVTPVPRAQALTGPVDLAIFHMGNHHGFHRAIHDELVAHPGLLVLHDPSLVDFYRAYHEGSPGAFEEEIARNHGLPAHGPPQVQIGSAWHLDRLVLQLARRVVEPSLATIVHSAWARDVLAGQFPHKAIHHVPLAVPVAAEGAAGPDIRGRAGWGREHVVFGLLGGLWAHKRPELVVQIFAALHPLRPRARLLVAGRLEDANALTRMRAAIAAGGLEGAVSLVTDVDDDEFTACISACDAIVDLRWPSAGETSATLMQAFGAGRPAIVSDLPQHRSLDPEFCWRVPCHPVDAGPAVLELMLAVARDPGMARRAGRAARRFVQESASLERVAQRYVEIARRVVDGAPGLARPQRPTADPSLRVSVSGAARSPETLRLTELALASAGMSCGGTTGVDLLLLGAGAESRPSAIAAWHSEDPAAGSSGAEETWVPSRFVAMAAVAAGVPGVAVVPWTVDAPPAPGDSRATLGLPGGATIFLLTLDPGWPEELQNPLGAVAAFSRAFAGRSQDACLVLGAGRSVGVELRRAIEGVEGIVVGTEDLRPLLSAADALVSLHRATAFGLVLAQAMYLGKPVIATAYSGNLDFMSAANSCLVGYTLPPGGRGAEPDVDQAAAWMRRMHDHPEDRRRIGAQAAADIRRDYSPEAVGRVMANRLRRFRPG